MNSIDENLFVECLRAGVERTKGLLARLTDYHGGPVQTEYLLTADLAREFIERNYEVAVECLNRSLVNRLTATNAKEARKLLKSKRTDIALINTHLVPIGIIELKIGVVSLRKIEDDLNKIRTTISLLNPQFAHHTIGAVVFQVHVGCSCQSPRRRRRRRHVPCKTYYAHEFKHAISKVEKRIEDALKIYASSNMDFSFRMLPLQEATDGIVGRALEPDGDSDSLAWGKCGHATRYHAIIIRKLVS